MKIEDYRSDLTTDAETYTYDGFNRLTQISTEGDNVYKYAYYPNGLRMYKDVNGAMTYFQWDGDNIWGLAANPQNGLTHYYYRGLSGIIKENYGAVYVYNGHGDVVKIKNSNGTVTQNYEYNAFGVIEDKNAADINPWRYCGEYYDTETGYIYLRARYYDPSTGAFISEDSHWNTENMIYGDYANGTGSKTPKIDAILQSSNLYVYAMSNPLKYKDLTGKLARSDGGYDYDTTAALLKATIEYNNARLIGDKDGMEAAQNSADAIRNKAFKIYNGKIEPFMVLLPDDNVEAINMYYYVNEAFLFADKSKFEEGSLEYGLLVTIMMIDVMTMHDVNDYVFSETLDTFNNIRDVFIKALEGEDEIDKLIDKNMQYSKILK